MGSFCRLVQVCMSSFRVSKGLTSSNSIFPKRQISKVFLKIWFNHTFLTFYQYKQLFWPFLSIFFRNNSESWKKIIKSIFLGLLNVTILYAFDRILLHMLILSMTILYDTYMIGKVNTSVPDPWCLSRIPDPDFSGSRIQGSKRHRIPDPDPQHWLTYWIGS